MLTSEMIKQKACELGATVCRIGKIYEEENPQKDPPAWEIAGRRVTCYFFFLKMQLRNSRMLITTRKAATMMRVRPGRVGAMVASSRMGKPKTMAGKFW